MSVNKVLTDSKLHALFNHFAMDNIEYITPKNMRESFAVGGRDLTDDEVFKMIDIHDSSRDGKLSFKEFKYIFFADD